MTSSDEKGPKNPRKNSCNPSTTTEIDENINDLRGTLEESINTEKD